MKNSLPAETLIRNYDPATYRMRTFLDVRDSFLEGSDSPRDYLERCMECIDSRETQVKAWVVFNLEKARQAADESGKRYRQGMPLSVIDGMPSGIQLMGQHHTDWNLSGYASWIMQTLKPIVA